MRAGARLPSAPLVIVLFALLAGCAAPPQNHERTSSAPAPAAGAGQEFWQAIRPYCGQAFAGELVSARPGDDSFRNMEVKIHIKRCRDSELMIPLQVGEDRSRTWVLSRHAWGVRLKHEHRNPDGSAQDTSNYGGLAPPPASGLSLSFPVDEETLAMLPNSVGGIWTLEIENETLFYQVRRKGVDAVFRLAFDLSEAVEPPAEPWGWEEIR